MWCHTNGFNSIGVLAKEPRVAKSCLLFTTLPISPTPATVLEGQVPRAEYRILTLAWLSRTMWSRACYLNAKGPSLLICFTRNLGCALSDSLLLSPHISLSASFPLSALKKGFIKVVQKPDFMNSELSLHSSKIEQGHCGQATRKEGKEKILPLVVWDNQGIPENISDS